MTGVATAAMFAMVGPTIAQQDRPPSGERVASFEMAWPEQKPESIAARVGAAVEVLTGRSPRRPVVVPIRAPQTDMSRLQLTVPDAPELEIVYLRDYDELRIVNTELTASTAPEREIPQDETVILAKRVFDELSRHKLVEPRHYDWNTADIASTWVGSGSIDGRNIERKRIEYRITVRRSINGIELANAGVRIAVHASGRVSGLRLGGVGVASRMTGNVEAPTGKGRWLNRQVANSDLDARFQREMVPDKAKAKIAWARVMYVMPENRRNALVEPLYVVSYSLEFPTDDGQTAVSRRKTAGLSLVDSNARPVDLTPPARPPEIEKTRKLETR
jgi:hypothetical protein